MDYANQMNNPSEVPEGMFGLFNNFHTGMGPITSLDFDTYEELLWSGHEAGQIVSHFTSALQLYTSFKPQYNASTHAFSFFENAVVSLTEKGIHGHQRQGLSLFNHTSPNLTGLRWIEQIPVSQVVLVGGYSSKIVQFDFEKLAEVRVIPTERSSSGCRSNGRFIYTTDAGGKITLRNLQTIGPIASFDAHDQYVCDFDVHDNQLVSCGYFMNRHKMSAIDPCVKIFDLRTLKLVKREELTFCPAFCRFVTTDGSNRILAMSHNGETQMINLQDQTASYVHQVELTSPITRFSFSPSKQCYAIAEGSGVIHVFSDRADPCFHLDPKPTEFADDDHLARYVPITDSSTPLSTFSMPVAPKEELLSEWPPAMTQKGFREPDALNDHTTEMARTTTTSFIGTCRNTRAKTPLAGHNVVPYRNVNRQVMQQIQESQHNGGTRECSVPAPPNRAPEIPNFYLNQSMAVRSGVWTNKSELILISDNDSTVPYVNPILTAFYHILPIRNVFLEHICFNEHCLSCQIGFLYRVLSDKKPHFRPNVPSLKQSYLASSALFMQSLKTLKEIEDIEKTVRQNVEGVVKLSEKTQKFLHFLLGFLQKELEQDNEEEGPRSIRDLLRMEYEENSRCLGCFTDSSIASSSSHVLTLTYPQRSHDTMTPLSFCHLVESSILQKDIASHRCEKCAKHAQRSSTRRVRTLPPVLLMDTDIHSEGAQAFWTYQLRHSERRPAANLNHPFGVYENQYPMRQQCRYGSECRTPNCRFVHPDTFSHPVTGIPSLRASQSLPDLLTWAHYLAPTIYVSCNRDGLCSVSGTATREGNTVVYHLVSAVMAIRTPNAESSAVSSHLVTEVFIGPRSSPPNDRAKSWVVVNDETAAPVDVHTALHLDMRWKQPVMLLYVQSDHPLLKNAQEMRKAVPMEVFWHGVNLSTADEPEKVKVNVDNIPKKGDLVGIDAEFIKLADGKETQKAGRVSCIDSKGNVLVDDYVQIPHSEVHDYVTKFSGIQESDLNPSTTTRYLTTQKYTYLKILYLIEQKVIFVGHGLDNDFRVLKLFAPPSQVRDTALLFHLPNHGLLALRFFADFFFKVNIQEGEHCSVEDARMALRVYHKYLEIAAQGEAAVDDMCRQLYLVRGREKNKNSPTLDSADENSVAET